MLDVLAPENSQELWMELCDRHAVSRESQVVVEGRSEIEMELLSAFAESYLNAQHWSTRRQIHSLMATLLDAIGCYMEELLLFQTRRKRE